MLVATLDKCQYQSKPKNLELDMKNHDYHLAKTFVEEAQKFKLKDLPPHLSYVFFGRFETLSVIIVANINGWVTSRVYGIDVEEVQASY